MIWSLAQLVRAYARNTVLVQSIHYGLPKLIPRNVVRVLGREIHRWFRKLAIAGNAALDKNQAAGTEEYGEYGFHDYRVMGVCIFSAIFVAIKSA